ncbi:MAG: hypothetical protein ACRDK2_13605, partial [Solirubrobacteraceae bacterium]
MRSIYSLCVLPATAVLLALVIGGCGVSQPTSSSPPPSSGPSISSTPANPPSVIRSNSTPAGTPSTAVDTHEPAPERGGNIPAAAKHAQNTVSAKALSGTPQQALEHFAQLYINWNVSTVRAHQLALAASSVGAARLTSEQAAAHVQGDAVVGQDSISNSGQVISIAQGVGSAQGYWVIVTRERTSGAHGYHNLPAQLHVTYAQVTPAGGG